MTKLQIIAFAAKLLFKYSPALVKSALDTYDSIERLFDDQPGERKAKEFNRSIKHRIKINKKLKLKQHKIDELREDIHRLKQGKKA